MSATPFIICPQDSAQDTSDQLWKLAGLATAAA